MNQEDNLYAGMAGNGNRTHWATKRDVTSRFGKFLCGKRIDIYGDHLGLDDCEKCAEVIAARYPNYKKIRYYRRRRIGE